MIRMEGVIIGDGRRCGSSTSIDALWFSFKSAQSTQSRRREKQQIIMVHYGLKLHGDLGIICCLYIWSYSGGRNVRLTAITGLPL